MGGATGRRTGQSGWWPIEARVVNVTVVSEVRHDRLAPADGQKFLQNRPKHNTDNKLTIAVLP